MGLAIAFLIICLPYLSPEHRITNDHTVLLWYLGSLAVTCGLFLCLPKIVTSSTKKYFITRVLVTGITGGVLALLLPVAVKSTTTGVGGLRHSILLATGGLIAIFTLGETRRKNDIDKKKNKQEKEKNNKDYQRQVRAERRERYTKAVEQLGDEKSTVRMGGVYTLVGLVDEWLEEKSLSDDQRLKEGQVIINNLCAYIRSPLTLASRANLQAEADVRLGIIKEIHDRLRGPKEETPGTWSDFEYDFSGSMFFYPVDLSYSYYLKSVNFSGSTYQNTADFSGSTYQNTASFGGSTYQRWANFSDSIYQGWISFGESIYQGSTYFVGSVYQGLTSFGGSTYQDSVDFSDSTYRGSANFGGSTYKAETKFNDSFYESSVDFSNSTYYDRVEFHGYNLGSGYECLTYKGTANFSHSVYLGTPIFGPTTYEGRTIFSNSIYSEPVNFSSSNTYKDKVDFSSSTYHGKVSIGASAYESQSNFRDSLYAEGADFTFAAFKGPHYFDGSVFYKALDLHGSVSYKEEPIFTHDYPTYTDPRPEYDKINRHITLFPAVGNDFTIILQGNQDPLDIPNLLKYCNFLDSLIPEKIEDYNQIINEIIITRDNFKSTQNIQEKDKYAEIFKEKNKELYKWREEATTVVLQNGVEVSD